MEVLCAPGEHMEALLSPPPYLAYSVYLFDLAVTDATQEKSKPEENFYQFI